MRQVSKDISLALLDERIPVGTAVTQLLQGVGSTLIERRMFTSAKLLIHLMGRYASYFVATDRWCKRFSLPVQMYLQDLDELILLLVEHVTSTVQHDANKNARVYQEHLWDMLNTITNTNLHFTKSNLHTGLIQKAVCCLPDVLSSQLCPVVKRTQFPVPKHCCKLLCTLNLVI
ncbi:hypothetical protein P879_03032 [Paragonimus westermani]|uniref:Uncharacterized protein n=1 Tax=Paragonimus westermani TaxID=34504 RepID=A0A8T0DY07_9TREM|nr:hypothetical protein P879_03032 [Paragonimus westermani]